ncbi:MAG: GNAT family N-acetyltransferase [Cyanobacteria bacterium P01_G01_bin.19]
MASDTPSVGLIQYNSPEYHQACQLRYQLFFAEHNLPWDIVCDESDRHYFHLAVTRQKNLLAYAQLVPQENMVYQICQMVVAPKYQRQGWGIKVLAASVDLAQKKGAVVVLLHARLSAIGFYQKLGFQICGVEFPSPSTRVMHVPMDLKL